MKTKFVIIIFFSLCFHNVFSQYEEVPLTKDESKKGFIRHYQAANDYASAHLYLIPGNKFRFENYTCLKNSYSEGTYRQIGNRITFTSDLKKGILHVKIEYRKRNPGDSLIKRIAPVLDADGKPLSDGILYINNDSTGCIYGDNFCSNELNSIDSIKMVLPSGVSSPWVKVKPENEIIQIKVIVRAEFDNYVIYNAKFYKFGKTLEPVFE